MLAIKDGILPFREIDIIVSEEERQMKEARMQKYCPPLDSALVAAIFNDIKNFKDCCDIFEKLANEANLVLDATLALDAERSKNEMNSGNSSSSNYKSSNGGETGEGSMTSVENMIDYLSIGEDSGSICSDDYIPLDEEIKYLESSAINNTIDSPTEFLKSCFPMISEFIDTLLQESDDNVEAVLNMLLNEQDNSYFQTSSTPSSVTVNDPNDEDNFLISESRFKRRKKKRPRKPKRNIIIQNNTFRSYANVSSASSSPATSASSMSSPSSTSRWGTPSPLTSPTQSTNQWNNNLQDDLFDENLSQLVTVFPDHDFERLRNALVTSKGQFEIAMDMLLSPNNNVWNGNNEAIKLRSKDNTQTSQTPSFSNVVKDQNRSSLQIPIRFDFSSNRQKYKVYDVDDDELIDHEDRYDPGHCRMMAQDFMAKRGEAFRKALDSYQRSKGHRNGEGGISFHYSTEGRKFDTEMKKWNLRAARSLVRLNSEKRREENVLDLHGCSVNEALTIVKEKLNQWYSESGRTSLKPLKIITGLGKHSPNGVAKLPSAINKFLVKDNWNVKDYKGYLMVNGIKNIP
ncbi:8831_t:CDS:2 [Funneliformis geosporum]|uniref:14640_t:CDS:1 n=1 Tax=Funneliformis geosporum TaxID=1117311 RepID=A0A9W4WV58_9GLOM|nr:8831_t:CDS:2 [Funneliformis geosporum]CAI2174462.1 14640_t:CDS:2 [Funneliformis geosporum]